MPAKDPAKYMRDYRAHKAGAGPDPQGQGVPAVKLPPPVRHVELSSDATTQREVVRIDPHAACNLLEERLREEIRLLNNVLADQKVELEAARIRVRYLEGQGPLGGVAVVDLDEVFR
jgi:hypothetical protein